MTPHHRGRSPRRLAPTALALVAGTALVLTACGSSEQQATEGGLETVTPGVLTVGTLQYMPICGTEDGKLTGIDGEIITEIAARLDLEVRPVVADFAGLLASVQNGEIDIQICGVSWTEPRTEVGLFTDPMYYDPPLIAVPEGAPDYRTISDLEGLQVGTITGYVWAEGIKAIPGATLRPYPDAATLYADIDAGRLDAAFVDPVLSAYSAEKRPDIDVDTRLLEAPTDAELSQHPEYARLSYLQKGMYLRPQATALEAAISEQLRALYESGEMRSFITQEGFDPEGFLNPPPEVLEKVGQERRGVDRPEDWTPAELGG